MWQQLRPAQHHVQQKLWALQERCLVTVLAKYKKEKGWGGGGRILLFNEMNSSEGYCTVHRAGPMLDLILLSPKFY